MKRALAALFVTTALIAGACGASEDEPASEGEPTSTVADDAVSESAFGDLDGPLCGEGEFTVAEDEAGRGTDKLYVGVPNDRGADVRPGLNKVLYDASVAFAGWCNEQGGIGGLEIEIIDMDAKLFEVEAVMTTACRDAFALVGGGLAQDALQFSGKPGSDFHECGMIDIPSFGVSPEKAGSNGQVQPVPNPGGTVASTWFQDFHDLYPEATDWTMLWAELPSLEIVREMYTSAVDSVEGLENVGANPYPVVGVTDWTPYALQVIETGADVMGYAGEVDNLTGLLTALRAQGYEGELLLETNMYDPKLLAVGADSEGAVVRLTSHPIEEADQWPAIQQYLDINEQYVEGGEVGALGLQSMSAWLLFTVAANACAELNDGVLDRTCILEQASAQDDWTGGGLHAPQDPEPMDQVTAGECGMLVIVKDGEFERLYPEVGGEGDDHDGFHCPEDGVVDVPAGEGLGKVDPDRPI